MKVAILGAGFTGLSAAKVLIESGHQVEIFEKLSHPGGLACGFQEKRWDWPIEQHYHHLFTGDSHILSLSKSIDHPIEFYRPKTATYIDGEIFQLDSPISLLKFKPLSIFDRFLAAFNSATLKFNPIWQPFEWFTAKKYILKTAGKNVWKKLWEPLFVGKFGKYSDQISAAWFWARIFKRSTWLGYPVGGFQSLANKLSTHLIQQGVKINYRIGVTGISTLTSGELNLTLENGKKRSYDKVICTLPTPIIEKISTLKYPNLLGLGAINLVVELEKSFFNDNTYWLNINDRRFPFLALVEHTNLINKSHYGNSTLLYIGNYLEHSHKYFSLNEHQLLEEFLPWIKKIKPGFSINDIISLHVFKSGFAQPIVTPFYSKKIPKFSTPIKNLYLANIQQVYPFDRGTNYAVEIGQKVAQICQKS